MTGATELALVGRTAGRRLAALGALAGFAMSVYGGLTRMIPEYRIYDGLWMIAGGVTAVAVTAPVVWRWPRSRSLIAVVVASMVGSWLPLVVSGLRLGMGVTRRLKGAWFLAGADVVGIALPVAVLCLWFALRPPDRVPPRVAPSQ